MPQERRPAGNRHGARRGGAGAGADPVAPSRKDGHDGRDEDADRIRLRRETDRSRDRTDRHPHRDPPRNDSRPRNETALARHRPAHRRVEARTPSWSDCRSTWTGPSSGSPPERAGSRAVCTGVRDCPCTSPTNGSPPERPGTASSTVECAAAAPIRSRRRSFSRVGWWSAGTIDLEGNPRIDSARRARALLRHRPGSAPTRSQTVAGVAVGMAAGHGPMPPGGIAQTPPHLPASPPIRGCRRGSV